MTVAQWSSLKCCFVCVIDHVIQWKIVLEITILLASFIVLLCKSSNIVYSYYFLSYFYFFILCLVAVDGFLFFYLFVCLVGFFIWFLLGFLCFCFWFILLSVCIVQPDEHINLFEYFKISDVWNKVEKNSTCIDFFTLFISWIRIRVYLLLPCKINYVNMQQNYVDMQHIYMPACNIFICQHAAYLCQQAS